MSTNKKSFLEQRAEEAVANRARKTQEESLWLADLEAEAIELSEMAGELSFQDIQDMDEDLDAETIRELAKLGIRVVGGVA